MRRRPALHHAALVGAVALVAACGSPAASGGSSSAAATDATPTASSESAAPTGPSLVAQVDIEAVGGTRLEVAGGLDWITVAEGSAWASSDVITRFDGTSGKILTTVPIPGFTCLAPDVGAGSLWFGVCGSSPQMLRVDAGTGKVVASIPIPQATDLLEESSVAYGAGAVWVLAQPGLLVRIDPKKNAVVSTSPAPEGASAVRASKDALWVTVHAGSTLLKLDPSTLETLETIPVGSGPQFLALGEGAAWTLDQGSGTVTRVDQATAKVTATIPVDIGSVQGGDIAVGGGFVWARVTDGLVAKIDPATDTVVARYGPPAGSGSVAADESAAWITAHDTNSVYRLPSS